MPLKKMKGYKIKVKERPDPADLSLADIVGVLGVHRRYVADLCRNGLIYGAYKASGNGPGGQWYFKKNWHLDPGYEKFRKRA